MDGLGEDVEAEQRQELEEGEPAEVLGAILERGRLYRIPADASRFENRGKRRGVGRHAQVAEVPGGQFSGRDRPDHGKWFDPVEQLGQGVAKTLGFGRVFDGESGFFSHGPGSA